jgi:hypothetical protein
MDMNDNNIVFTLSNPTSTAFTALLQRVVYLSEEECFAAADEQAEMFPDEPRAIVHATRVRDTDWVQDYGCDGSNYLADCTYAENC